MILRRLKYRSVLLLVAIAVPLLCPAQENIVPSDDVRADTLSIQNERFYDSLATKSDRKGFTRFIYRLFVKSKSPRPDVATEQPATVVEHPVAVIDEAAQYRWFEGKTVRSIDIVSNDVYIRARSWLQRSMNALHINSRRGAIRRDLLFREGDRLDPNLLVKNKQLLTSRAYLYEADILVTPSLDDPSGVDVKVVTHDRWTINVGGSAKGLSGRASGDIYDANLLGSGNKFRYRLSFDWRTGRYEGSLFEYSIPNILGTFFTGRFLAGRSFWDTRHEVEINKRFVVETDYEAGVAYKNHRTEYYILYADPERFDFREPVSYQTLDLWLGKSFNIPAIRSSIYGMAAWYGSRFTTRPDYTAGGVNPAFHDRSLWLGSLGLYSEKFLTTRMTYSYGNTEYLATGYKAEITGGWLSGEFNSGMYAGASLGAGKLTSLGYFMGSVSAGGFYDISNERIFGAALNFKTDYFTRLINIGGRTHLRQFVSLNYVKGWNRAEGAEEWIGFTKASGPHGSPGYTRGRERAVLKTETVVFTPWEPLDFRIALYGYFDAGFIGDRRNLFRNDFYSTLGIGIRLNNERLVFGTLQLHFSVMLRGKDFIRNNPWINLNDGTRMQSARYLPQHPGLVEYR